MKPENILVLPDGGAKICDVGCLVKVDDCGVPVDPKSVEDHYTPAYAAPELCCASLVPLSLRPSAIFSLGVMCRALLGRRTKVSPQLDQLLSAMTQPLPFNRPSIHRVLQHEWFHIPQPC